MNETQKTGIFAAVAALAVLLAFLTRPVSITKQDESGGLAAGDLLFKDEASDVTKASSLKITKFDENKLSMESFEIVRDKDSGLWKIPSEYSYPADADEQLKNATSPLAGLKILSVIGDAGRSDHGLYGVVEPSDKLEAGVTGVGMMVYVADSSGKSMASLIIGKKLEGTQDNLHYVRIPNQDPVYTVEIDTSVFNTDFKKWIKPDLLTVKSVDIQGVGIRDYRTQQRQTAQGVSVGMERTMEADFNFDANANQWTLERLVAYEGATPKPDALAEGDEIKSDKLNSIRTAAQSLQIVGVRPKPKGLAADLKADKSLLENQESMISLLDQGFVPLEVNGATEILATAGETILTTREGVKYTLRFGEESMAAAALDASGDEKADATASKRERFLLVTAAVDESRFPAPELQPIPQTIQELKKLDEEKAAAEAAKAAAANPPAAQSAAPADPADPATANPATANPGEANGQEAGGQPAGDQLPIEPSASEPSASEPSASEPSQGEPSAGETSEGKSGEGVTGEGETSEGGQGEGAEGAQPDAARQRPAAAQAAAAEAAAVQPASATQTAATEPAVTQAAATEPAATEPAATEPAATEPAATEPAATEPAATEPPATEPAATEPSAAGAAPAQQSPAKPMTDEELKDRLSVVQSDITKANQRLIDARNDKLTAARKKVQELNARFADWYYLIDDASFKQLMLKRDVLIGPKAAPPAAGSPAFPGASEFPGIGQPPGLTPR